MVINYIVSGLICLIIFIAILSEKVHRTIIALAGAVLMVSVGMALNFYSQEQALEAIDFNTLGLLAGMMILVNMLERTGFFQYLATVTAKKSKGKPWLLLLILGAITTIVSTFLDNVTTVVLIAPVTILIAEIVGISPIPILMAEALLSNIGGVATLVGDPPNILIGSAANLSFNSFLTHLGPIVLFVWIICLFSLKLIFKDTLKQKPKNIAALEHLDETKALRDRKSLNKILIVLGLVIFFFFIHHLLHLKPAFIALGGGALALLWVRPNVDEILRDIEWSVLVFFAALFVAVGGVEASGLLGAVAGKITGLASTKLLLACVLLIWISAILSSIIDNIPFTMVMIPIILKLGASGVNITPLWWALAIGAGFGGNGTPIGSTAGVIVMSISEKTDNPINLKVWLKSGLPIMLISCLIATVIFVLVFKFMQ